MMQNIIGIAPGTCLKCQLSVGTILASTIIWFLLSMISFGLALFVWGYYFYKSIINNTKIVDAGGKTIGRLKCEFGLGDVLIHGLLWAFLTFITLGIAFFFYVYKAAGFVMSRTEIECVDTVREN